MIVTPKSAVLALTTALLLPLSPALATTPTDQPNARIVAHADLDLARSADVARLQARVSAAIRRACPADGTTLADRRHRNACRVTTEAAARQQVQIAVNAAKTEKARLAERKISDLPQG